ncbi:MAG: serine/threonine protein kinase [Magnetococcales bacterium]|nr:serine/threonine protein kinase [Magnetococcales bacterium]
MSDPLLPRIDGYHLLHRLGRRADSVVYSARELLTGNTVAVKIFPPLPWATTTIQSPVADLWEVAALWRHPHVVLIHRLDRRHNPSFVVMEMATAGDLGQRLFPNRSLIIAQAVSLARQVLLALTYLHTQGYLHLDIKPANLLQFPRDHLKIADFGLIRPIHGPPTRASGSPGFMSPEQIMGLALDQRSDLFSSGALLYRLVTGQLAATGSDIHQRLANTLLVTPPWPSHINKAVSPSLSQVIMRALEKRPSRRFSSAHDFLQALDTVSLDHDP